jgi:hypothetical protein
MKDRSPMMHRLKTWPEVFAHTVSGKKTFEIRKNDRNFAVGDALALQEWNSMAEKYTGKVLMVWVEYILHGGEFGIPKGYVIMSIRNRELIS